MVEQGDEVMDLTSNDTVNVIATTNQNDNIQNSIREIALISSQLAAEARQFEIRHNGVPRPGNAHKCAE